jgi:DNA-binding CsgD family transcriptional regulator
VTKGYFMVRSGNFGKVINEPKITRRPIALSWERSAPNATLRQTGICLLGNVPWGTHICLFYETLQDLSDTAALYFNTGLENNEFCLWVVHESIPIDEARNRIRDSLPNLDRQLAAGHIEIVPGRHWTQKGTPLDIQAILGGWREKLRAALARGYDGMRVGFNSVWQNTDRWEDFCEYERVLDKSMAGEAMLALCTYAIDKSSAQDALNVARAHQCSIALRSGHWDFLQAPGSEKAKSEIRILNEDLDILSRPFAGRDLLTPREKVVLGQIIRGLSSKEAGRALGISPRTVDFHRANIMEKTGAQNAAGLVRLVLGRD